MTSAPKPRLTDCGPATGDEPWRAAVDVLVAVVLTPTSLGPLPQCALRRRYAFAVKGGAVGTRRYGDAQRFTSRRPPWWTHLSSRSPGPSTCSGARRRGGP